MAKRCIKIIEDNKLELPWLHRRRNDSGWMALANCYLNRCLTDMVYPDGAGQKRKKTIRAKFSFDALKNYNDAMQSA